MMIMRKEQTANTPNGKRLIGDTCLSPFKKYGMKNRYKYIGRAGSTPNTPIKPGSVQYAGRLQWN